MLRKEIWQQIQSAQQTDSPWKKTALHFHQLRCSNLHVWELTLSQAHKIRVKKQKESYLSQNLKDTDSANESELDETLVALRRKKVKRSAIQMSRKRLSCTL